MQRDHNKRLAFILVFLSVVLSILFIHFNFRNKTFSTKQVRLEAVVMDSALPARVQFQVELNGLPGHKVKMQPSIYSTDTKEFKPGFDTLTHLYHFPGFHRSFLYVDSKKIAETTCFVPTNGWTALIIDSLNKKSPHSIDLQNLGDDSLAKLQNMLDSLNYQELLYAYFNDSLQVHSDSFRIKCSMPMTLIERFSISLISQDGMISVPILIQGDAKLIFGQKALNIPGEAIDSALSKKDESVDVEIIRNSNDIKVSINNENIFSKSVKVRLNEIKGIYLSIQGSGIPDSFIVSDLSGKEKATWFNSITSTNSNF